MCNPSAERASLQSLQTQTHVACSFFRSEDRGSMKFASVGLEFHVLGFCGIDIEPNCTVLYCLAQ